MSDFLAGPSYARPHLTASRPRKSDRAYQLLKRSILLLELAPGALLDEAELIQRFKIGRTPLREALQHLATESLVNVIPRRGTFVSPIHADGARAVFEMRCNLDAFAAKLAAQRASEVEIARLESLIEEAKSPSASDPALFDQQIHEMIMQAAHNPYLEDTLKRLYALSVRLFNLQHYQRETLDEMIVELGAVVHEIRRRDPEGAALAALVHITSRGWFPELRFEPQVFTTERIQADTAMSILAVQQPDDRVESE